MMGRPSDYQTYARSRFAAHGRSGGLRDLRTNVGRGGEEIGGGLTKGGGREKGIVRWVRVGADVGGLGAWNSLALIIDVCHL